MEDIVEVIRLTDHVHLAAQAAQDEADRRAAEDNEDEPE